MKKLVNTETTKSVKEFIDSIENESKREDSKKLLKVFKEVTGKKPKIWGKNYIIGFGKYKYTRKGSKDEYEWFNTGFAPRKANITIYVTFYLEKEKVLLKKLGKSKQGKGCLYINKLDDIDVEVLKKLIEKSKDAQWHS